MSRKYLNIIISLAWMGFLLSSVACKQPKSDAAGKTDKAAPATPAAKPGAPAVSSGSPACDAYVKAVCAAVGEKTSTCDIMGKAAKLLPPKACEAALTDIDFTKQLHDATRKSCNEMMEKICADLGPETKTCEMVRTQTKSVPAERCEMMLKQYPQVIAELKKREAANKPLGKEQQDLIAGDSPCSFGKIGAKVSIVEFSDFQCPYCSKAADVVAQIKKKYGNKIRMVFRHFPLGFHKDAHLASQASIAAAAQGKFFEYHDLVFANQKKIKREDLDGHAKKLGLDMTKFKKALDKKTYAKAVDADIEMGKKVTVKGTPTMFINGERVQNPTDFAAISKNIDKILSK